MNDLPWFPLWVSDFSNSRRVRTMTPAQVGIYILLLCSQWEDGPIPDDEDQWGGLTNNADANDVRTIVERCFKLVPGGWVNLRLEEVRDQQKTRSERLSNAGRMAGIASGKARSRNNLERPLEKRSTNGERKRTSQSQSQITTTDTHTFEEVWGVHHRGSKKDALREYRKAVPSRVPHEQLVGSLRKYVATFRGDFHGANLFRWIRDSRWEELELPTNGNGQHWSDDL